MCQDYDSEWSSIQQEEASATITGFAAARAGKAKSERPYWLNKKRWELGWESWHEKHLPWAILQEIQAGKDYSLTVRARNQADEAFKKDRSLPPEIEKILNWSHRK